MRAGQRMVGGAIERCMLCMHMFYVYGIYENGHKWHVDICMYILWFHVYTVYVHAWNTANACVYGLCICYICSACVYV